MGWDCDARDANLHDSKRRWRLREMTLETAKGLIPGVTDAKNFDLDDLDASWAADVNMADGALKTKSEKERRDAKIDEDASPKSKVRVLQIQWLEFESYVKTVDPYTQQQIDMPEDEFEYINR
jgi:hypothetical protein